MFFTGKITSSLSFSVVLSAISLSFLEQHTLVARMQKERPTFGNSFIKTRHSRQLDGVRGDRKRVKKGRGFVSREPVCVCVCVPVSVCLRSLID